VPSKPLSADAVLSGTLHVYVAFDGGEEVDRERAAVWCQRKRRDWPGRPFPSDGSIPGSEQRTMGRFARVLPGARQKAVNCSLP